MNDDRKVNIALVGLGGHGVTLRRAVKMCGKFNVVACFDIDKKLVEETASEFMCRGFDNYDEMLSKSNFEAVVISTPNFLHFEQALKALNLGKDVFVEKPIAVKVEEAKELAKVAEEKKLIIQVGHNTRKRKVFRKAKEFISDGILGKIISVEANISMPTGLGRFPEWKRDREKCPLLPMTQLGIHFVDTLIYFFGEIKEIACFARDVHLDVEDSAVAIFKFSNGLIGVLTSSYVCPDIYEIRISGTDAILKCSLNKVEVERRNGEKLVLTLDEDIESYVEELCEFADCVLNRKKPEVDAIAGLKNLEVINAMIESYLNKTIIKL